MPELYFTPYQEKTWLQQNGYNPEEYYIEAATGSVLLKNKIQPAFNADQQVQQIPVEKSSDISSPSVLGSFGRGALSELPATGVAIPVGARVASALTPLATQLAPSTRGLSYAIPPIAGIGAGLLGSLGIHKLQDVLLPESIKQTLAQDVATNPKAFLAGQVTSALPLLKPSISNLGRAAGTTGQIAENVITGGARPLASGDVANLVNVGLGLGTGIGSTTIPNLIQGRPIDPLEVALAAGGGALFSEPTKLGQKLGLTATLPKINRRKELERIQVEGEESLAERAFKQQQAQVKAKFLKEEPRGLRAQLIKAEQGTSPEKIAQKQFDIGETDIRPRTFYSESKVNEKGETKYLIPFNRISKEDKLLFPSLINEKGTLRAGVDEAMFREKLDQRLYGDEFQKYKDLLEEAKISKQEVGIREQQERTQELAKREETILKNITQAAIEERKQPGIIKPVEVPKKEIPEKGERKFTIEQLARKPVTTLRQKAYNKEANYQYWKELWRKASIEGNENARKEADKFIEEGFVERYRLEEIEGKPQPKFSELETLPSKLLKKPTVFEEAEQGLNKPEIVGSGPIAIKVGNKVYAADSGTHAMLVEKYGLLETKEPIVPGFLDRQGNFTKGPSEFKQQLEVPERLESAKRLEREVPSEKQRELKAATFDYFKEVFGPLRNIEVTEEGNLKHSITGKSVKGEAILREGINKATAKLNPLTATIDTLGHEPFHIFVKDLETSPHKIDRDTASGFYKAVEASPDFKRINENRISRNLQPFDANEIGTEEFGIEFARRVLNPLKMEDTLKQAWRDLLGRIRIRWGKASVNDYTRLLTERFFRDPDYIERFTGKGITPKPGLEQPKEEKEIYEPTSKQESKLTSDEEKDIESSELQRSREEQIQSDAGRSIIDRQEQKIKINEPTVNKEDGITYFYEEGEQGLSSPLNIKIDAIAWDSENQQPLKVKTLAERQKEQRYLKPEEKLPQGYKFIDNPIEIYHNINNHIKDSVVKTPLFHFSRPNSESFERLQPSKLQEKGPAFGLHLGDAGQAEDRFKAIGYGTGRTFSVYAKIKNPLRVTDNEANFLFELRNRLKNDGLITEEEYSTINSKQDLINKIKQLGYDGLVYKNEVEGYGRDSYVVFDDDQLLNTLIQVKTSEGRVYSEEEQGLKTYDKNSLEYKQKNLLDEFKRVLSERKIYEDINVTNRYKNFLGKYFPDVDKSFVVPNNLETALHESIHRLYQRGRKFKGGLLDVELKDILDYAFDNNVLAPDELRQLGKALREEGSSYATHNKSLNYLANIKEIPKLGPTSSTFDYHDREMFAKAIDEILAQYSDGKSPANRQVLFGNALRKIFGNEFTNFFSSTGESRSEKYFPKYERLTQPLIDTYKEKLINLREAISKIQNNPEYQSTEGLFDKNKLNADIKSKYDLIAKTIKDYQDRVDELIKRDTGRYYEEESQGLTQPKEILEKIKSIRTAPEFQKESVFKKGIREVISSRIPVFGSDIDKLEIRGGESGKLIAPALREYFAKNREYEGKYLNPVVEQLNKLNNNELDNLYATMLSEKKQQISLRDTLQERQRSVYDVLRRVNRQKQEDQIKAKQPVQEITKGGKLNYRLPRIDPFYIAEIVGSKQLDILLNAQGSQAYNNLRKDFINFQKKNYDLDNAGAIKMFDDLIASYGGPVKGDTTHFGAVRRSEGFGLPESWLEGDLTLAMRRYWRRVAKDRAFYDTIENDDNLLHIIGHKRDAWGNRIKPDENITSIGHTGTLGDILDIIQGQFIKTNPRLDALGRIASNLVLGPITGITDLINAAPILAKFIPSVSNIPGFLKASLNVVEGIKAATRQGIIRENITSIGDIMSPADEFVEKLRQGADLVSKANTREYLEKVSRGLSQAFSDYLIGVHLNLAKTGNKKSQALLEGLANQKDYTKLSQEQLASRLVELHQGTYDPRGLPSWAIDSQIAPFFRLAKWNIEQLNNLHKHVLLPLKDGNITPLLMTIGGGLIGGYLAKEVREKLNAKKQAMPEFKEILASKEGLKGNIPDAVYNIAAAISYSGVTGLLGDLTKAGFDVAFKNTPQGFNYPLVEIIGDGAVKIGQAADAIIEGENPINVTTKLLKDIALNHVQIGRIAANQIESKFTEKGKEKFEDIESRRNLRAFKMVENLPYPAQGIQSDFENPYIGLEAKEFKKRGIKELPVAAKEASELTRKALKRKEPLKKLSSFKRNTFQTIPSPTNDPIGFSNFIRYNTEVRGEADTRERLQRYFQQNLANQIKGSFIP